MYLNFFDNLIVYSNIEIKQCAIVSHDCNWTEHSCKSDYDIWIVTEGEIEIETADNKCVLKYGDSFFLFPDIVYHARCISSSCKFIFIHFDFKTGGNIRALDGFDLHGEIPNHAAEEEIDSFITCFLKHQNKEPLSFFALKGYLIVLLAKIIFFRLQNCTPAVASGPLKSVARLQPVFDYISRHMGEIITIKDISRSIGLSEKYFHNLFKKILGITPNKYITDLKLSKALDYLYEGKYSVKEIASRLGYCDQYAFSKAFKRKYGTAPSKIRRP